jgi:hypothetical protein
VALTHQPAFASVQEFEAPDAGKALRQKVLREIELASTDDIANDV